MKPYKKVRIEKEISKKWIFGGVKYFPINTIKNDGKLLQEFDLAALAVTGTLAEDGRIT